MNTQQLFAPLDRTRMCLGANKAMEIQMFFFKTIDSLVAKNLEEEELFKHYSSLGDIFAVLDDWAENCPSQIKKYADLGLQVLIDKACDEAEIRVYEHCAL